MHLEILAKQNATVRLSFVDERRYTYRFATAREAQGFCAVLRSAWRRPTSERKEDPKYATGDARFSARLSDSSAPGIPCLSKSNLPLTRARPTPRRNKQQQGRRLAAAAAVVVGQDLQDLGGHLQHGRRRAAKGPGGAPAVDAA